MKSKIRKIVVEEKTFAWRVIPLDPHFVCLRIWIAGEKRLPWAEVRRRFDNPWLHYGELVSSTPEARERHFRCQPIRIADVAWIIREITALEDTEDQKTRHRNFEWTDEDTLCRVAQASVPGRTPF